MTDSLQQKMAPTASVVSNKQRIWAIVGASSGNLVEWFDFYVYSFFSLYFAHVFFWRIGKSCKRTQLRDMKPSPLR